MKSLIGAKDKFNSNYLEVAMAKYNEIVSWLVFFKGGLIIVMGHWC